MKKIYIISILVLGILSLASLTKAAENSSVVMQLNYQQEITPPDGEEIFNQIINAAKHFESQYPGDKIYDDFSQDVAAQFPELTPQQVYDYEGYIRNGMQVYRYVMGIYEKYKESLLVPEEPPLIVKDNEYDLGSPDIEYIESDGTVVVQDFKKIISYSQNPRDIKAYRAKFAKEGGMKNKLGQFKEIGYIFSQLELKKIPFYDIYYSSPLTGNKGIGNWVKQEGINARLISKQSGIMPEQEIKGLIHFTLPSDKFITAADNATWFKPQINFDASKNLKSIKYDLPLPTRLTSENYEDLPIYIEEIAIPYIAEVDNPEEFLQLSANIRVNLCNLKQECAPLELQTKLNLQPGYVRDSSVSAYIDMIFNAFRPNQTEKLKLDSFRVEKTANGNEFIKLEFTNLDKVEAFNLFVSNSNGISFERPRVSIDGKHVTVRLLPIANTFDINNKDFEITAVANNREIIRFTQKPTPTNASDSERQKLTFVLAFAAFLGGLLLNFMPCVFPVLSLKLLSLTKFGARSMSSVRRNFAFTLLGIFSSFAFLATILAILKYFGEGVGWGMQFQNPWFISLIVFAVLLFIAQVLGLVDIKTPQFINRHLQVQDSSSLIHFLTGTLVVLMATPCTAPYLGTAVGFALAGSIPDIYIILGCVALGLSTPYLIIYLLPQMIIFMPSPGPWMQKINRFMLLMLLLTLVWLFHIFQTQSGSWFIFRLGVYSLLFMLILWLNSLTKEMDFERIPLERREQSIRKIRMFFNLIAVFVFAFASVDGYFSAERYRETTSAGSLPAINQNIIDNYIKNGQSVIVRIDADWCLTCRYNDIMVFKNPAITSVIENRKIVMLDIDWTVRSPETVRFMQKYGRSGLPFYLLFSPLVPDGMVLPEMLNEQDMKRLLNNMTLVKPGS